MGKNNLKQLGKIRKNINPQSVGITLLLLLSLAGIFYIGKTIYKSGFFRVLEVDSNVNIESYIKNYIKGKSLLTLDINKIYKTIAKIHPEYKKIQVIKEFPSSVRVIVSLRRPFVQFYSKNFYLLDRDKVVLSMDQANCFPQMIVIEIANNNVYSKGDAVRDARLDIGYRLIEEIKIHKFLNKFFVKSVNVTFPESCYFLMGNIRIVIGNDDFPRRLYILENILNEKLRGDISSVEYIDLRYKKAYVGYKQ